MTKFKAACVQINSGNVVGENIERAIGFCMEAVEQGATFIAMPENVLIMPANFAEQVENAFLMADNPPIEIFKGFAAEHGVSILLGGVATKLEGEEKLANRSYFINAQGQVESYYDKIHMFDVDVAGGESHRESDRYKPGEKAVLVDTEFGKLGMSICYDVRFPQLYRGLAREGAEIFAVPAAFTKKTGELAWNPLLKARAIEDQCFVIAPAQTGEHPAGRQTYGHSMIIDPFGRVLADAGKEEGVIVAEIDLDLVQQARKEIPSLESDRGFSF